MRAKENRTGSVDISIIKMNFIDLLSLKCLPVNNCPVFNTISAVVKIIYEEYKAN